MDSDLKEKFLRLAIMALETAKGHLKTIELHELANQLEPIITQCNEALKEFVPDAEPGVLPKRKSQE
jgi:hypothetical protein